MIARPFIYKNLIDRAILPVLKAVCWLWTSALLSITAFAQTSTYSNTNTTGNAIGANEVCGTAAALTRTFVVPATDDFIVGDLDVGFLASHPYRGDIVVDLTAPDPSSTTVRIIAVNGGAGFPNYSVLLDDDNSIALNTGTHANGDGTSAPPYDNDDVSPSNALSAFNGLNSVGTWTMTMCDDFAFLDDGNFLRADLYFTHFTPNADLSLSIAASDTTPDTGTNVVLTYEVANAGTLTATGVTVDINLPTGLSYVSDNGGASFNDATGLWTLPASIASGSTASLEITAFVALSGPYNTSAEVQTSDQSDIDSTPGNNDTSEDDYDTRTLIPMTPPVPSLLCPGAASVVDWDVENWPSASLSNSYIIDGETITMTVVDNDNSLGSNAAYGGQAPSETTTFTGGYANPGSSVAIIADQPTLTDTIEVNFDLGDAGVGVEKLQLTLFDVDLLAGQFQDQISITGTLGSTVVTPTLTTGASNGAIGTVVTGSGPSDSNVGDGNMTIEFFSPIDSLTFTYGNGAAAGSTPGNQWVGISDIFFCPPTNAILTAEKTTAVYDPLSEGLYAIPGNDVVYTIEFTNTGSGPADLDSVFIIDSMPDEIEFFTGDFDGAGNPVLGIDNGSSLSLDYATDVRYSKATTKPASFAECGDGLTGTYDGLVNFICLNPSGVMAAGTSDPSFQIQFRARIK